MFLWDIGSYLCSSLFEEQTWNQVFLFSGDCKKQQVTDSLAQFEKVKKKKKFQGKIRILVAVQGEKEIILKTSCDEN